MFQYAVRFLNKIVEFDSFYPPQQFLAETQKYHDLFALPELDGFQVWQKDDIWIPLYGVKDRAPRLFLDAIVEADEVKTNDLAVGERLVSNYRAWKMEMAEANKQAIYKDVERSLLDELEQKMRRVKQGIDALESGVLQVSLATEVFSVMTQPSGSLVKDAQTLHVSIATLKRYKRAVREGLGSWALRNLSQSELQDLLEDVRKNVPRIQNAVQQVLVKF